MEEAVMVIGAGCRSTVLRSIGPSGAVNTKDMLALGYAKPAREIFDKAASLVKLDPREILFVGDDFERDYQGALNARMKPLLIDRQWKISRVTRRKPPHVP